MTTSALTPAQQAAAIDAHGVGVKAAADDVRPSTWTRWHEDERTSWRVRLDKAQMAVDAMSDERRLLLAKVQTWKTIAAMGWGLLVLIILAGMWR